MRRRRLVGLAHADDVRWDLRTDTPGVGFDDDRFAVHANSKDRVSVFRIERWWFVVDTPADKETIGPETDAERVLRLAVEVVVEARPPWRRA